MFAVIALGLALISRRETARDVERAEYFAAVESGTPDEVRAYLDRGWSPNEREHLYSAPLPFFAQLERLLSSSPHVEGQLVLYAALKNRRHRVEVLQLLISRGARVKASEGPYDGPIINQALETEDRAALQLLLDNGAEMPLDETPLRVALWRPHAEIVNLLLLRGAKVPADWRYWLKQARSPTTEAECRKIEGLLKRVAP